MTIDRPAPFLSGFTDCIDAVECIPEGPNCPGSRWQLWRGGKPVGEVVALWDEHPYGAGPDHGPGIRATRHVR